MPTPFIETAYWGLAKPIPTPAHVFGAAHTIRFVDYFVERTP
jgi:hypothetical protein